MLKKMLLLVALVALVASTQVFAADEAATATKVTPPPARERTAPAGGGQGMARGMGGMGRGFDVTAMFQGLDLTEEQKTKMQEIQKASAEKTQAAQTAQMQAMMKVNSLVMSGGDEAAVRAAAADYAKAFTDASVLRAKTVGEIKALLTAEQKTKFEEQVKTMGQMGQGGGRGARGGAGADGAAPRGRPAVPAPAGEQK
jgi:Spy/CpxP family protein refolding chaperone